MSNDINQCNFIGRLGADPETRYTPAGDPVCSFRIAVGWKSKEKEGAEWVPISTFGKLAEICGQYLVKGSQVFVSGRMKTDEYEKDGVKRYSTKIVADRMQMLGGRAPASHQDGDSTPAESQPRPASRSAQGSPPSFEDLDDDIPFRSHGAGKEWRVI